MGPRSWLAIPEATQRRKQAGFNGGCYPPFTSTPLFGGERRVLSTTDAWPTRGQVQELDRVRY